MSILSHELSECEPIASVGKVIVGSKYSSPDIDAEIDDIIASNDIHILLPFIDPGITIAARCSKRHPDVFVPVSDEDVSGKMFDRCKRPHCLRSLESRYRVLTMPVISGIQPS